MNEVIYEYTPIEPDEIRLLSISRNTQGPVFQLETFKDHLAPEYKALSYAWGEGPPDTFLFIEPGKRSLKITQHLANAIHHFVQHYRTGAPVFVWIDAICIQQHDDPEKAAQVRKMGRIYNKASSVVAWLGVGDERMDKFFNIQVLTTLLDKLRKLQEAGDYDKDPAVMLRSVGLPEQDDQMWQSLSKILCADWFRRGWIVQEVVLAQSVEIVFGRHSVPFNTLIDIMVSLGVLGFLHLVIAYGEGANGMMSILDMNSARDKASKGSLSLPEILQLIWGREVSKPIDKIYSLLGLVNDRLKESITVDYRNEEDCQAPILQLIKATVPHDFDFYLLENPVGPTSSQLPSWCFKLDQRVVIDPGIYEYQAGKSSCPTEVLSTAVRLGQNRNILEINGFKMDEVLRRVTPNMPETPEWCEFPSNVSAAAQYVEYEQACRALCSELVDVNDDSTSKEAYCRALFLDRLSVAGVGWTRPSRQEVLAYYDELLKGLKDIIAAPSVSFATSTATSQFWDVTGRSGKRSFFVTKHGCMGWGPTSMQCGDVICIFYGADTPYVLRYESQHSEAVLIGPAFVEGLMSYDGLPTANRGADEMIQIR